MPRRYLGPRLYYDTLREGWVIRDGHKFIRTGAAGWKKAEDALAEYCRVRGLERPAPPPTRLGYVYFISAEFPDYPIKIGWTAKMNGIRVQALQTSCPYKLVLLASAHGTFQDENKIQKMFDADRLYGEWFKRSEGLMYVIADFKAEAA